MERETSESADERKAETVMGKKFGGIKQRATQDDDVQSKLDRRMLLLRGEVLLAAEPDAEPFDDEPPDDLR